MGLNELLKDVRCFNCQVEGDEEKVHEISSSYCTCDTDPAQCLLSSVSHLFQLRKGLGRSKIKRKKAVTQRYSKAQLTVLESAAQTKVLAQAVSSLWY